MAELNTYKDKYSVIRMERDADGILLVTLHTEGDALQWGLTAHREIPLAFHDIADDHDNRVVILTGTGKEFTGPRVIPGKHPLFPSRPPMELIDRLVWEGKQSLLNFLNIDVPVISAINGPAWRHSELPLLADIVLASETTKLQDSAHFPGGLVPGDGMHIVYPFLMGVNRARYFLLTGEVLDARQAKDLGLVNEVLPEDKLMPRAFELARQMAKRPKSLLRLSKAVLTEHLKRHVQEYITFGLYAEMIDLLSRPEAATS
jgi:enoyl-CoA hydratase/carnithine racemase